MAPITSFAAEYVWRELLGNETSVFRALFPEEEESDGMNAALSNEFQETLISCQVAIIKAEEYIERSALTFRQKMGAHKAPPKKVRVIVLDATPFAINHTLSRALSSHKRSHSHLT